MRELESEDKEPSTKLLGQVIDDDVDSTSSTDSDDVTVAEKSNRAYLSPPREDQERKDDEEGPSLDYRRRIRME